jgi:hypothetical protein
MNWRLLVARDWLLRFGTFTALWLVALIVTLALGALCVWLAFLGGLPAQIGVNEAIFVCVLPPLIVLVVMIWQGRIWRRDWLWNRWYIRVD